MRRWLATLFAVLAMWLDNEIEDAWISPYPDWFSTLVKGDHLLLPDGRVAVYVEKYYREQVVLNVNGARLEIDNKFVAFKCKPLTKAEAQAYQEVQP